MSKFSLDKLKGGRGRPSPPAFRFHTDDSSMEEVKEEDGGFNRGAEHELSTSTAAGLVGEGDGEELVSPVRDRILTKFAKLAPSTTTSGSVVERLSRSPSQEGESWLGQVRGRLAGKTDGASVAGTQDILSEEKEQNLVKEDIADLPKDDQGNITDKLDTNSRRLSHSHSEATLLDNSPEAPLEKHRPHSQIFDFDNTEFVLQSEVAPKPPQVPLESAAQDIPRSSTTPEAGSPTASSSFTETPTKSRKRFGMPSFLNRRQQEPAQPAQQGSPGKVEVGAVVAGVQGEAAKTDTPRRSLKERLMSSYAGRSAPPTPEHKASSADMSLPLQDPFSGLESTLGGPHEDCLESSEQLVQRLNKEDEVMSTPVDDIEVEEGLEVGEELNLTPDPLPEVVPPAPAMPPAPRYQLPPALIDLVNPLLVCLLAVSNFLLPSWLAGFTTGLLLTALAAYWLVTYLHPPVSHSCTPVTASSPIPVHEPPAQVQAWMNLLPHQFHPYDVDTYEVRNTVSVRVTIEHHMLKVEYPEWNIPKRLNTDEVIDPNLKFLFHSDHIDLSTARISLLPDGIAGKRMFSKKYPIEIRQGGLGERMATLPRRKLRSSEPAATPDSDGEDSFHDVPELESDDVFKMDFERADPRVFYLFARADREKEDLYKSLMDAHHFLTDTVLDVARREGAITEGIDRDAKGRETVRERKTRFSDFMARNIDSQKSDPSAPIDSNCLNFLNVFLNRIFYDIHKSEEVKVLLKNRIYNKLLKIKITQWFKTIELTEINMGSCLPRVSKISNVHQTERGLWVELGIEYNGVASATIETCGLNLGEVDAAGQGSVQLKALLEEEDTALPLQSEEKEGRKISSRIEAATNSEEEDSAEEDTEDSQELPVDPQAAVLATSANQEGAAGALAASRARWWEVVGNSDIVKSGIKRVSNSDWWKQKTSKKMTLHLEIVSLAGVIVLNIPPPPSDRLWYSFKERPELGLRIVPFYGDVKLGEDNTFFSSAVNKTIEVVVRRLKEEIHKFVLLPNMDDIPIRIMDPFLTTNAPSMDE